MRAVLQRVTGAAVRVERTEVARIGVGLVVLLAVGREDTERSATWLAEKVAHRNECLAIVEITSRRPSGRCDVLLADDAVESKRARLKQVVATEQGRGQARHQGLTSVTSSGNAGPQCSRRTGSWR